MNGYVNSICSLLVCWRMNVYEVAIDFDFSEEYLVFYIENFLFLLRLQCIDAQPFLFAPVLPGSVYLWRDDI